MDPYGRVDVERDARWVRDPRRRRFLIVDTCVLRDDVLRRARTAQGLPTRMIMGSGIGAVRIFAAPHVVTEMDADIRRFAAEAGLDSDAAEAVWNEEYRPVVVVVDVDDLAEAMSMHPLVAPTLERHAQDAPSAVLSALLGQRVLSLDKDLVQVGTGRPWLQHVIATTDAGTGDRIIVGGAITGEITVRGAVAGARRAYIGARAAGGAGFANCFAGAVALCLGGLFVYGPTRRWILATPPAQAIRRASPQVAAHAAGVLLRGVEGDRYLRTEAVLETGEVEPLAAIARLLATAANPLGAAEIAQTLRMQVLDAEIILDSHLCFCPTEDERWQLGRPYTRQ